MTLSATVPGMSTLVPPTNPQPVMIGGVVLPINPQQITERLPRQVVNLPVMRSAVRTDFGNGIREWSINGHTGHGGLPALLALKKLEAKNGKPQVVVPFLYPWKYGFSAMKVYVDDCQWEESVNNGAFTFYYTITLREASAWSNQPPIIKVVTISSAQQSGVLGA